jgi:hypothetical protein
MPPELKHKISHRGQAFQNLLPQLPVVLNSWGERSGDRESIWSLIPDP